MTHSELVECARKWLIKKGKPIVITELKSNAMEEADAIAFDGSFSYLIECKASRSDFLADAKKLFRNPDYVDALGTYRWYMAPSGLIKAEEIPRVWGFIEIDGNGKAKEILKSERFVAKESYRSEMHILTSLVRRIGQHPMNGVSVKCYQIPTSNTATVSVENSEEEAA